jgi:ketosteroid isomerase-like protein
MTAQQVGEQVSKQVSKQSGTAEQVVRAFSAALAQGDLDAASALARDDLVFSEPASLPFGGEHVGADGLRTVLGKISRDYRLRLQEPVFGSVGQQVVVKVTGSITARASGATMPLEAVDLYTVGADGLISRVDVFYRDAAAVSSLRDTEIGSE